jgi:hypothetical protein
MLRTSLGAVRESVGCIRQHEERPKAHGRPATPLTHASHAGSPARFLGFSPIEPEVLLPTLQSCVRVGMAPTGDVVAQWGRT